MTYRPARQAVNPYQLGYDDGARGHPLQFYGGAGGDAYRNGWYDGYRQALTEELSEYNRRHGTNYEVRT